MSNERYVLWLENMVILLSKEYQDMHNILSGLHENNESNICVAGLEIKNLGLAIQVDKISQKTVNIGEFSETELDGYTNWLIDQYSNISKGVKNE